MVKFPTRCDRCQVLMTVVKQCRSLGSLADRLSLFVRFTRDKPAETEALRRRPIKSLMRLKDWLIECSGFLTSCASIFVVPFLWPLKL